MILQRYQWNSNNYVIINVLEGLAKQIAKIELTQKEVVTTNAGDRGNITGEIIEWVIAKTFGNGDISNIGIADKLFQSGYITPSFLGTISQVNRVQ